MANITPKADLKGRRFGKLKVIEYVVTKGWLCKCDCGKTCHRVTHRLMHDVKKGSCGCSQHVSLKKGRTAKAAKKPARVKVVKLGKATKSKKRKAA